jgi:hypothetical protein
MLIESRLGARFSSLVQTGTGAHPASYTMGTGSTQDVKRPERGVNHPPDLVPRLKKECCYASTHRLGFVACSWVNFTFFCYLNLTLLAKNVQHFHDRDFRLNVTRAVHISVNVTRAVYISVKRDTRRSYFG